MKRRNITDRAHRYRANSPENRPLGPKVCAVKLPNGRICRSRRNVVPHHEDGNPSNTRRSNLIWACKSCNTRLGKEFARKGIGRRTRQYNPGADNLAQYVQAAVDHTRGAHDAGGKIIHETPKAKRRAFAREIWFRRTGHMRNPSIMEVGSGKYQVDNGHGTILTLVKKSWGGWEVHADNIRARVAWRGPGVHAFNTLAEVERKYKAFRGIAGMIGEKNPPDPLRAKLARAMHQAAKRGDLKAFSRHLKTEKLLDKEDAAKRPARRNAFEERIQSGSRVAVISANERSGPFWTRVYVNNGETATLTVKKAKTIEGARKQAREMLSKYGQNPGRRNSVASTILEQLGGRKFSTMTGAKNFVSDKNSLRFKLPANFARRGINLVRITLDPSDTYTMEFMKMRGSSVATIATRSGVYDDSLRSVFTSETGLDTSLGSMGKNPGLVDGIRAGDRVTIVNRFGQQSTGRAVMRSSSGGWVLNMGGRHGTPGLADDRNVVRVSKSRRSNPDLVPYAVIFRHAGKLHTWERYAETAQQATTSARKALEQEYPRGSYSLISVKPMRGNPNGAGAAELYTKFHGRGPDKSYDLMVPVTDPYTAHPEIAQLGKLLSLTVGEAVKMTGAAGTIPRGTDSEIEGWAEQITFNGNAPDVAAEPGGKQIYLAGGDQNLDSMLERLGADPSKELLDLGFCYRIEYMTQKKFDSFRPTDYWHLFGEETGVQPRLIYDRVHKLIQLVGGEYLIKPEGIVN